MTRFVSAWRYCAIVTTAAFGSAALAQVPLATWTFETSVPTTAGPHAAEGGVNAGAGSPASGFHADAAAVYSNPAGNGSAESFSSTFWNTIGDYYQFATSTTGYNSITIEFDQARSNTGPATFDLVYSTDGLSFSTLLNDYTVLPNAAPNPLWANDGTRDAVYTFGPIAVPGDAANKPLVTFRLVSQVAAATGGTNRVDNVTIAGVLIPEPSTLGLLALGAIAALRRRS